ncbi:hypothetical protein [Streptomyces sp. NPDC059949]|uniref:hypothetical protein n=1 Tax=Streptomyces sp. NPDC059949 TaxID=3347013 RepID=UPI0036597483
MAQRTFKTAMKTALIGVGAATTLVFGTISPAAAQTGSPELTASVAPSPKTEGSVDANGCEVRYFGFRETQVQVHNCPGNGAESWAWIWSPNQHGKEFARVYLNYAGSSTGPSLDSVAGGSASQNFSRDIGSVQICESWGGWQTCVGPYYM